MRVLKKMLFDYKIRANDAEINDFNGWLVHNLWNQYQDYCMEQQVIIMNQINNVPIVIANGTQGKSYVSQNIELPSDIAYDYEFEGLEELGLNAVKVEGENVFNIQGIPNQAGDFTIILKYKYDGWIEGRPILERKISFAVNPDPRTLWKNIPTSTDVPFYKPDADCEYVKVKSSENNNSRKDIVAASNRGRSHAQEGKARDDHYQLCYDKNSDWYIIAVADGAGSAKYSRKGSEVACRTVIEFCREKLLNCGEFESQIKAYVDAEDEGGARKCLGNEIYSIIGNAAFKASKAISEVASRTEDAKAKDFATTLLFTICKKFDFGWFLASFWVGDGAMCIYNKEKQLIKVLGTPDEGEFSGQTRFLTMPEIFADYTALYKRLRFSIEEDFTALLLMTDGVSDPMFGTDANLNDIDKWNELWNRLHEGFPEDGIEGVDLSDDNENAKNQLLNWLNFWKAGEHDDRTIAILY